MGKGEAVQVIVEGAIFQGRYYERDGTVRVTSIYGSKAYQRLGMAARLVAQLLLTELVIDHCAPRERRKRAQATTDVAPKLTA